MIRGIFRAGLAVLCCLGFGFMGCSPVFAAEYTLDQDYTVSSSSGNQGIDWSYIPEYMTFDEWEDWEPTAGELRDLVQAASSSEASPSSAGPALRSSYLDVYDGSISTTQLSYFTGIVRRFSPKFEYVLFRQDRYLYRLVYAEDMVYDSGVFTASDAWYILYNTEYNTVLEGMEGNFRLTPLSYPVYTSLEGKYPDLDGGVKNETKTIMFMLAVMFVFNIVSGFFVPGRYRWG